MWQVYWYLCPLSPNMMGEGSSPQGTFRWSQWSMLMGIIPNLGFLKLPSSGVMGLVLSTNCAVRHQFYPQCTGALKSHMSSKKHSNGAGQSSMGSASKRRMHLTSYLWKKIGMLWKNYGKAMEFLFWGSVRTLVAFWELKLLHMKLCPKNLS